MAKTCPNSALRIRLWHFFFPAQESASASLLTSTRYVPKHQFPSFKPQGLTFNLGPL